MGKRELRRGAILLGGTHFLVDLCCTAALTALALRSSVQRVLLCAILYNGLAFAFQLPIGALADRLQLSRSLCAFGCLLVAVAGFFAPPILVTVLLGLGNACFHVGGGREALHRGGEKAAFVGYFVAPGAMGIFLGPLCAKAVSAFAYIAAAPLLLCAFLLFVSRREGKKAKMLQLRARPFHTLSALLIMGCMFLTVLLRSYMGSILHYPFQSKVIFSALFVLAIVGGKFCGGVLADRFGVFSFTLWAQLCAVLLFVLSDRKSVV